MKKAKKQVLFLGLATMMLTASCGKKDKTTDPDPNKNDSTVVIVDPGIAAGSLGSVSFKYNSKKITYTSVRTKDGGIWLQQNLGANRVATSMTDQESYGDLYQWGRWDDGHQLRTPVPNVVANTTLSANNPSGLPSGGSKNYISNWWTLGSVTDTWVAKKATEVSASNGCDPCKILGAEWHIPTVANWESVLNAENITNNQTAFASNLKIPTGGWRNTNSSGISSAGTSSWYWTNKTDNQNSAIGIWIQTASVQREYKDLRSYGTSIRCVKYQ